MEPKIMKAMEVTMKYNLTDVTAFINLKEDGTLIIIPEEPTECIRKIEIPGVGELFK